jgi:hypothetical protein
MRPEIEAYLRDNGARYTTKALRQQLINAGHDPAEVDAALLETEVSREPQFADTRASRSRFWWSVIGLHVAAFLLVTVWVVSRNYLYAPIAAIILALLLLVGLGISGLIGRALLPRSGLMVALLVPLLSVVGLSGVCLAAISGSQIHVPPRPGVMQLTIDPPLSFQGSGAAECFIPEGGFTVHALDLGSLDGRLVSASLNTAGDPGAQASAADLYRAVYLHVTVRPRIGSGEELVYIRPGDVPMQLNAFSDGLSGTLKFEGLAPQSIEAPPHSPGDSAGPAISGTISWTCE